MLVLPGIAIETTFLANEMLLQSCRVQCCMRYKTEVTNDHG